MIPIILAALGLGFLNSAHCIVMCGPLAMALPVKGLNSFQIFKARILHQWGRVMAYVLHGFILGYFGRYVFLAFQKNYAIFFGFLIAFAVVAYFYKCKLSKIFTFKVPKSLLEYSRSQKVSAFILLGFAQGFLPCMVLFSAWAVALGLASPAQAAVFMLFFGIGTWPTMVITSYFGSKFLNIGIFKKINISKYAWAITAVVFITKGLMVQFDQKVTVDSHGITICFGKK